MKKRILILLGILIIGGAAGVESAGNWDFFGQEQESGETAYVTRSARSPETLRESQTGMPVLWNRRKQKR